MIGLSMAARNVLRYKRRTLITASAIAFGVMFTIVMEGFTAGSETETIRNLRDYETGELKVYPAGYFADRQYLPFDRFIEKKDRPAIETLLAGHPSTPRAVLSCEMYFTAESFAVPGSVTAELNAVDPARDGKVFRTATKVSSGRWLVKGDTGIVIGSWLAEDIGAKVGYTLTIECRGRGGFYQTFDAAIIGIVKTDDPAINRNAAFMDLALANELLSLDDGVTEYSVRIPSSTATRIWDRDRRSEDAAGRISAALASSGVGAEARDWQEIGNETIKLLRAQTGETALYLFFIFVIAIVGITNTMLMAVIERRSEIGTLRALGFTSLRIRALFLAEGACIGAIGSFAGTVFGACANWYLTTRGMDFSFMLRDMDVGYRITGVIRSAWDIASIARTALATIAISAAVAWFPSGIILRREVADILRKQG